MEIKKDATQKDMEYLESHPKYNLAVEHSELRLEVSYNTKKKISNNILINNERNLNNI